MSGSKNDRRYVTIADQDNQARISARDGQQFTLRKGDSTAVEDAPVVTAADDNVRVNNFGDASTTGPTATVQIDGDKGRVNNFRDAEITAEGTGVSVAGEDARINNFGTIAGDVNGVNFENGGESSGTLRNFGTISSDSRAVNIGGEGVTINNFGTIEGTGDQRNGTIYSDGTADDFTIRNFKGASIDAGEGNQGAGIALQLGDEADDTVNASVTNFGTIAGRGQGAADTGLAGDGIRIFAGSENPTFEGDIRNFGSITSESTQGPVAGIRVANGVNFDGNIVNGRHAEISGANNGVYFGTGDHDAEVRNFGTISSDSRAVNIDGTGVELNNFGLIVGTGDQRNGTVYSDATADEYSIVNQRSGTIDAGEGNQGAGVALQTGDTPDDVVSASITNRGDIVGRGQAAADTGLAGDGIRIFAGTENPTFEGDIFNSGSITSESQVGPTAGLRVANGVNFDGKIVNARNGEIAGANTGLYFGTGEHDAEVLNYGTISSDSRAVNIDGSGVDLVNAGRIVGTGDQRNGTVYADGTAEDYSLYNARRGTIDAGEGNNGSAVSLQTGDVDGDIVSASVSNAGKITGRGDAEDGNQVGDGVRVFSNQEGVTFEGDITNTGRITASTDSDAAVAISIEDGVTLDGQIVNRGLLQANEVAIDATEAGGSVDVLNTGRIDGQVRLSANDDRFDGGHSRFDTDVDGGAGDDQIKTGSGNDLLTGGLGNDVLNGGRGKDTASFQDQDVPVTVDFEAGTATRETGFSIEFQDASVGVLGLNPNGSGDFVQEALAGNLYFNIHTADFGGGEIRGQLDTIVDDTVDGNGTITISGTLDAAQEPGPLSDSDATGTGTVTIQVVDGVAITYSVDLDVSGLATSDLTPVAIFSAIHLHNAPRGVNGPVALDVVQDAGGDVNGDVLQETVFDEAFQPGFSIEVEDQPLASLTTEQSPEDLVNEALDGNLYFNIHTTDFPGGEIRGQLELGTIKVADGVKTITLNAVLDSAQEPGGTSDSDATGRGTVVITVEDGDVSYSSSLTVNGIDSASLLPVAGVSAIHLHNAPAGINGPVITDVVQDAGGDVTGDLGDEGSVFNDFVEPRFTVDVDDQPLASLTTEQSPQDLINEALKGNLYFNIHTTDFPGGEIRGQLELEDVDVAGGVKTITLSALLDSAQEPGGTSDSDATGQASFVITVDGDEVTYSTSLTVDGIDTADLLPVAGVSSIHLHNAPAGINGPVITDIIQDAGGDVNGVLEAAEVDPGDGNVFIETLETDQLIDIENVIGSDDSDVLLGDQEKNELVGNEGDDVLNGRGGDDLLEGGGGADVFIFEDRFGRDVVEDFQADLDDLDLTGLGLGGFEEALSSANQVGDDVVFDFSGHEQITLRDLSIDLLTEENVLV